MKYLLLLGLLLVSAPAYAQTTATPSGKFLFDEAAPDLATANGYTYKQYVDGAAVGQVVTVTCTGAASPFTCAVPVGAFTLGPHTIALTAGNIAGESAKSVPFAFTMVLVPAVPGNIRYQP